MEQRRVSIEDIAKVAGVSHSTVSRALRNNPLIRPEVREQIKQVAREMGYVPNAIAQSLQNRRTNTIGVVVTSIADPFFAEVVNGIEQVAKPAGFSVILSASHRDSEQELAAVEGFHRRRVDGILVGDARISDQHRVQLARIAVPTVLINTQVEDQSETFYSVMVDDFLGARLAVEHLLGLGHRAIGYLGAGNRPRSNQRRLEGYRRALSEAGIMPQPEWAVQTSAANLLENDVEVGQQLLPGLLAEGVSAVFCYNDMMAVGALMACRELGLHVPGDLSVAGFDDIALARYVNPPLTTVHQPMQEIGRFATQMLLDLLDEKRVQNHVLTPFLVERGSSAPPKTEVKSEFK